MKFRNLAWGTFIYKNRNNDSKGESDYNKMIKDEDFLQRIQTSPTIEDFERVRTFLAHFGVHWVPKDFSERSLIPLWPFVKDCVEKLSVYNLLNIDFNNPDIKECINTIFDWPFYLWGSDTVRSKVIHFFNTKLFVMWDNPISLPYMKYGKYAYFEFNKQCR